MSDAAELAERRRRRLWLIGASGAFVAVLVAIGIALGRADDESGTVTGPPDGAAEALALYRGIPQRGSELGSPSARVEMIEFADLQCPFCACFSRDVMPTVVSRYVRPGKVRYALRTLAFIGEDSREAAEMALAAGRQGKLHQFVDLVYRNQGAENEGWVDEAYLRRIARAAGLDVERAFADLRAARGELRRELDAASGEAEQLGIAGTPTVLLYRRGSAEPVRLEPDELTVGDVTGALDEALAGR